MTNTTVSDVNGKPGGLARRCAARLIDVGLAFALQVVFFLLLGFEVLALSPKAFDVVAASTASPDPIWIAISAAMYFLYFVGFEAAYGRTPGKRLLGLRVYGPAGAPKPTLTQAVVRNSFLLLWLLPYFLDAPDSVSALGMVSFVLAVLVIAISIQVNPTRQGIHDRMAGRTQVVKLNRAAVDVQPPVIDVDRAGSGVAFSPQGV